MKTKDWFRNNKEDWDALSESTKRLLWRHSPYDERPSKAVKSRPSIKPRPSPERGKLLSLADGTRTVADLAKLLSLEPQTVRNKIWWLKKNGFTPMVKGAVIGRPWPKAASRVARQNYINVHAARRGHRQATRRSHKHGQKRSATKRLETARLAPVRHRRITYAS